MMTKTQKEYREFEQTLLKTFKNKIPNTKEQLSFALQEKGFRQKRCTDKNGRSYVDRNYRTHENTLNYAWDFLQKKQPRQKTLGVKFRYVVERGNKRRSTEYFEYKGKKYYKGRFVPKDLG